MLPVRSSRTILALCLLLAACGDSTKGNGTSDDSTQTAATEEAGSKLVLPVVGDDVIKGDLVLSVNATGTIKSEATTMVKSETQGTVAEVLVRPGDRVRQGQVMARLDTKPLELALERAEANHRNAQARYSAEIIPDSAATGAPPTAARRAYARASSGLETAEVDLREAHLNLERAEIKAPFDGVIERVAIAVGERISSGADVAMVVDITHLRVDARVMEHDIPLLSRGGDAQVMVAAMPGDPIRGTIAAVLPLVDSAGKAGTAVVRIRGDGKLRPGMYAEVRLEANRLPDRIIVPERALVERDGRPLVFVVKNGIAEWVYVNPGRTNGRQREILPDSISGLIPLAPGDIVLIDGHLTLTHQAPVRLVAKNEVAQ
ncbi:MAG TPA: efflux RND transporter periplasmic adaptor subunit [Gemmatimonadales bacterium]|nr:efflux RND transporter periplasmic adaptor subunit [Gemmatimonadales bacterium]